jgi:hypothetical protein
MGLLFTGKYLTGGYIMGYEYNASFNQAVASVPYSQQYAQQSAQYPQQAAQAPINFGSAQQAAYAPQTEEKSGPSLGGILLAGSLAIAGIAAHKANGVSKALKEAGVKEGASFGKLFGKFINPMSWFKNGESLEKLGAGFSKVGDNRHLIQNAEGEKFILTGKNVLNSKGEAAEDLTKIISEAKEAPKAAEETTEQAAKTTAKRTPATLDDNINLAQSDVTRVDGSIKKIQSQISELEEKAAFGDNEAPKAIATLNKKLSLFEKAKAVKEVESLEAQKLKLEAVQANDGVDKSQEIAELTQKIDTKVNEAKANGFANIENKLSANKAYKENQIFTNAAEGKEATAYEQAYVNLDGNGIFKPVNKIEGGKFLEKKVDNTFGELTIDKKLSYNQQTLADKTSSNKVVAQAAHAQAIQTKKDELNTLLQGKLTAESVEKIQKLAAELNTNLNISAIESTGLFGLSKKTQLQVSQTFSDGTVLSKEGDEAISILSNKVAKAA